MPTLDWLLNGKYGYRLAHQRGHQQHTVLRAWAQWKAFSHRGHIPREDHRTPVFLICVSLLLLHAAHYDVPPDQHWLVRAQTSQLWPNINLFSF